MFSEEVFFCSRYGTFLDDFFVLDTHEFQDVIGHAEDVNEEEMALYEMDRQEHVLDQLNQLKKRCQQDDFSSVNGNGSSNMINCLCLYHLRLDTTTANAIVDFFQQQQESGKAAKDNESTGWIQLVVMDCIVDEHLYRVLESARSLGMFSELEISKMSSEQCALVLNCFGRNNPVLKYVRFTDDPPFQVANALGLAQVLDTKTISNGTRLESLSFFRTKFDGVKALDTLAKALKQNDSLQKIALCQVTSTSCNYVLPNFFTGLVGHPSLTVLYFGLTAFSPAGLDSLGMVVRDPRCQIIALTFCVCRGIGFESQENDGILEDGSFFVEDLNKLKDTSIAAAMQGSTSLKTLVFADTIDFGKYSGANLYRILGIADSCPSLRCIDCDFFPEPENFLERSSGHCSQNAGGGDGDGDDATMTRKGLYRLGIGISAIFYRGNNYVGNQIFCRHDEKLQEILMNYPALSDFGIRRKESRPRIGLSANTVLLLSYNYAGRARLDRHLSPCLWYCILQRADKALNDNYQLLLQNDDDIKPNEASVVKRRCYASIIFQLLVQCPSQVTLQACSYQSRARKRQRQRC